ncbi:hypothetical protein DN752_17825 [Echinicola strongylocentroti]|uniref:Uncharacterized protein n=2 Tax=Echinicola strongylocentroti TaxID=1795355 RepID=A0A2Z4IM90_9BACT|nr:hypothetical protein DN752_17825 [Echinicola strongylocentroti]
MVNEEQLEEVEELAGCFFTEEEILEIIGLETANQAIRRAIRKGLLKQEAALRKSIIDLAVAGSSPAQTLAFKMLESVKRKEY